MILKFRAIGCSMTEIAQRLGRNKATVSRKLQRNSINGIYSRSGRGVRSGTPRADTDQS
ncbi:MAG: helix-turn-helix domain-containing protein [Erysipelotrichaceae bacterium]|nr:helix-turn-helix domain-containing protein [Erysipelotrichaceae bacterium]